MADVMFLFPLKKKIQVASLAITILVCASPVAAKEKAKTSVEDLRYGVTLYHYYQQDYLSALAELMVADSRDGIQGHGNNPELIAGGISLSFGMQNHAESVFNAILKDESRPQYARDAAWFYLGKLQYLRSDFEGAARSFENISNKASANLQAQVSALKINIAIRQNNFTGLNLKSLNQKKLLAWSPYATYNLGSAYARNGNFEQAEFYFNELNDLESEESALTKKELWALQDKAATAMGYTFLAQKKYDLAVKQFTRVRLDTHLSHQALLGLGWAYLSQQQYEAALSPWQLLSQRSLSLPAAQESILALPFAYEKLQSPGDALAAYQEAESRFTQEIQFIREMRQTLTEGELLTLIGGPALTAKELQEEWEKTKNQPGISAAIAAEGEHWLKLESHSIIKTRSAYLSELFSQSRFQTRVLDIRDLLHLQQVMQNWQPKLTLYKELLVDKQANRSLDKQKVVQEKIDRQVNDLVRQRDAMTARINRIETEHDYLALADKDTRQMHAIVKRSEQALQKLEASGKDSFEAAEKLRMFKGILIWRAAQSYQGNMIELQKNLQTLVSTLDKALATQARIREITSTSFDIQPMMERINKLTADTNNQLTVNARLLDLQTSLLRHDVDTQLEIHEKRLSHYLAQSQLAIARLYDTELRKQSQ
jgi:tetratricopeptide (TPR) repeat protein